MWRSFKGVYLSAARLIIFQTFYAATRVLRHCLQIIKAVTDNMCLFRALAIHKYGCKVSNLERTLKELCNDFCACKEEYWDKRGNNTSNMIFRINISSEELIKMLKKAQHYFRDWYWWCNVNIRKNKGSKSRETKEGHKIVLRTSGRYPINQSSVIWQSHVPVQGTKVSLIWSDWCTEENMKTRMMIVHTWIVSSYSSVSEFWTLKQGRQKTTVH